MIDCGLNLFLDLPVAKIAEVAQEGERLGFTKCWVYDEGLVTRDPYIALTAIALKTKRIGLGTGITNPYTRHPGITAASIATLDELSGGRAFLGIGTGGVMTLDPLGLENQRPLVAVREMIETSRTLFRGETVTYHGQTVNLSSAKIDYARPDLEIWFAGRGPKMLAMGGELADGVALDFVLKERLEYWVAQVCAGAARSGRPPRICYSTAIITSEATLNEVRPHMSYRLLAMPPEVRQRIGLTEADAEAIRRVMAMGGIEAAGKLVKDEWIDPFVIAGSPEECAIELKCLMSRYHMDEFLLPVLQTANADRLMSEVAAVLART